MKYGEGTPSTGKAVETTQGSAGTGSTTPPGAVQVAALSGPAEGRWVAELM